MICFLFNLRELNADQVGRSATATDGDGACERDLIATLSSRTLLPPYTQKEKTASFCNFAYKNILLLNMNVHYHAYVIDFDRNSVKEKSRKRHLHMHETKNQIRCRFAAHDAINLKRIN